MNTDCVPYLVCQGTIITPDPGEYDPDCGWIFRDSTHPDCDGPEGLPGGFMPALSWLFTLNPLINYGPKPR